MASQLPPGWSQLQDPHGRVYFYNSATNTSQWHPPHWTPQAPPPPNAPPYSHHAYPSQPSHSPPGYPNNAQAPTGYPTGAPSAAPAHMAQQSVTGSAGANYTYGVAKEFKLKEKAFSLSGDGFSVKDVETGATVFKVKGKALSVQDTKKLVDASGNSVYTMREALLSMRRRMTISDSRTKQDVVVLRRKSPFKFLGGGTVQVWKGSTDEGDPWFESKSDFLKTNFVFKDKASGRVLASVKRKAMNLSNLLLEKDTYVVRVEAGVDTALFIFLAVAIDEMFRDDGNQSGLF